MNVVCFGCLLVGWENLAQKVDLDCQKFEIKLVVGGYNHFVLGGSSIETNRQSV